MAQVFVGGNILMAVRAYIWGIDTPQNSRVDHYVIVTITKTLDCGYQHACRIEEVPSNAMLPQVTLTTFIQALNTTPANSVAVHTPLHNGSQLRLTAGVELAIPSYLHLIITTHPENIASMEVYDEPRSMLLQPELDGLWGLEHVRSL
ncbi:hypothetical protein C8Q78DRAFT_993561 [Trametes maxima]|nr:hypothetical protein C8Q78DRAFT_993561 [Trametes maxima]